MQLVIKNKIKVHHPLTSRLRGREHRDITKPGQIPANDSDKGLKIEVSKSPVGSRLVETVLPVNTG